MAGKSWEVRREEVNERSPSPTRRIVSVGKKGMMGLLCWSWRCLDGVKGAVGGDRGLDVFGFED